jgi:hypothetical protein
MRNNAAVRQDAKWCFRRVSRWRRKNRIRFDVRRRWARHVQVSLETASAVIAFFLQKRGFLLTGGCYPATFLAISIQGMEDCSMQEYEDLKRLVAEIESDINKAEGGNKAAGTRVRKQMQTIKQAAQLVRNRVLEIRSTD